MNKGEKILWHAVNQIVSGSEDNEPPFSAAPREVLIELARKAIEKYRHLTSHKAEDYPLCPCCGLEISIPPPA